MSGPQIEELLRRVGLEPRLSVTSALAGGSNNRVYRVDVEGHDPLCVKAYYRDADDQRDRGGTECAFSRFAWDVCGLRNIPEPITFDADLGLGLYSFVDGRAMTVADVKDNVIDEALAFVESLNRCRSEASDLPSASEACFDLASHLSKTEARLRHLREVEPHDDIDMEMHAFIAGEVEGEFRDLSSRLDREWTELGLDAHKPLDPSERCVSPSDFGFHNALITRQNDVTFLDFEYAGWDDPAKLICDFFCQPAVPVPPTYFEKFAGEVASMLDLGTRHLDRVRLLFPLHRVKWVCIVLNAFLATGARRRSFAAGTDPEVRTVQLAKARSLFGGGGDLMMESVKRR